MKFPPGRSAANFSGLKPNAAEGANLKPDAFVFMLSSSRKASNHRRSCTPALSYGSAHPQHQFWLFVAYLFK